MTYHLRYVGQVALWKWYVFRAGLHTGAPIWRLVTHDLGRLRPAVWGPFARFLFGPTSNPQRWMERYLWKTHRTTVLHATPAQEEEAKQAFADARKRATEGFFRARLRLQHRSRWDWSWWVLRDSNKTTADALEMPEPLVRELIADWAAAVRDQGGKWDAAGLRRWYALRRDNVKLHLKTRKLVAEILDGLKLPKNKEESNG